VGCRGDDFNLVSHSGKLVVEGQDVVDHPARMDEIVG